MHIDMFLLNIHVLGRPFRFGYWVQLGVGVSHGLDMMQVCTGAKSEQQSKLAARKVGPCY
jgi:hypothetical protein